MKKIVFGFLVFTPSILLAAPFQVTSSLVGSILPGIIRSAIVLVASLALLYFFWGLAEVIRTSKDDYSEGRSKMLWGIIILFVMFSVWGIVRLLQAEFLGSNATSSAPPVPTINGSSGGLFGWSF